MPEGDHPRTWVDSGDRSGLPCQPDPLRRRDGDVELNRHAEKACRLRLALPVGPQAPSVLGGLADRRPPLIDQIRKVVERARSVRVKQQVPRRRRGSGGGRPARAARMSRPAWVKNSAEFSPGTPDGRQRQLVQLVEAIAPDDHGHAASRPRPEEKPRLGDHGQRALGPASSDGVVVAGVVLDQPGRGATPRCRRIAPPRCRAAARASARNAAPGLRPRWSPPPRRRSRCPCWRSGSPGPAPGRRPRPAAGSPRPRP